MRKIRFLLFTVSFLAIGSIQGAALFHAFASEKAAAKSGEEGKGKEGKEDKKENKKEKGVGAIIGGRFAGDPIYVHITPMILPVISDNGVEQLVTVILDVQVKDLDAANALQSNMPRVMDSLMRNLYGGLGEGSLRKGKLVNVTKIKNKAIYAIGEIIGAGNVHDVLIQSVAQRML